MADIKVVAKIPQVYFDTVVVSMPEEVFENGDEAEMAQIVFDQLSGSERDWLPQKLTGLIGALEVGYSTIKKKCETETCENSTGKDETLCQKCAVNLLKAIGI